MTAVARRIDTTPVEALVVTGVCFGWAIWGSLWTVLAGYPDMGGFTDAGAWQTVVTELACAAIALVVLYVRRYDVATLVPEVTLRDTLLGLALMVVANWAGWLVLEPFLAGHGEQPIERIAQATTISAPAVLAVSFVNGTFEEVFLLGFLQRGLQARGLSIALGVTLLVRVVYHLYQGPLGALSILAFGLVQGLWYAHARRLWSPVFAHIMCDIVAFLAMSHH
ncbi:MAG: CPBP family intramembrane glutamic endopeptidase [Burkholderiaceae bacterium]